MESQQKKEALLLTRSWAEARGKYKADHGFVLTRSGCFGLHTRLGSDFIPTDNDSDNDCRWKRNKTLLRGLAQSY